MASKTCVTFFHFLIFFLYFVFICENKYQLLRLKTKIFRNLQKNIACSKFTASQTFLSIFLLKLQKNKCQNEIQSQFDINCLLNHIATLFM